MPKIVTRFAPSPTGFLHIGGARTALFNWLYAKRNNGQFLLRIEDTDKKRSTKEAIDAIIKGLSWLGIDYDGEVVFQSQRIERHIEAANHLVKIGKAYYCFCPPDDTKEQELKEKGAPYRHKCTNSLASCNTPAIRFKVPSDGETAFNDNVYGTMKIDNAQLDDIVILRSDMTPTYIFAVVIDDHDMGITQIIRGSDHLTNTFKQLLIYQAFDFNPPNFAHVPLIHDENGHKLSKRHNALSVVEYEKMGILPKAMRNYLLRLGWGHNNDEVINDEQAVKIFSLQGIGRSPARLDFKKLEHLNSYYINNISNEQLLNMLIPILEKEIKNRITERHKNYLLQGLTELKKRANSLISLAKSALFYVESPPIIADEHAYEIIKSNLESIGLLASFLSEIINQDWNMDTISIRIKEFTNLHNIQISEIYKILRASIVGTINSPSIIDIMVILDKDECLFRLKSILKQLEPVQNSNVK
ncbi:MAG: glutamate--tRNA ligase 2 [Candidatus Mesenet longicola]|uniref:Glutamate--tRNA ligase n=1 Tax=Candidatus Mesenet longicola TaxID=1892558 RepID=A0A8J3MNY1_9RICK|nr:MAG: glutamate--tRNA ligase 2 [Candidatus Mesenet longicola]GHM59433.1 MAG: glutamate--tRNA ligase 2 [Candidatus Mesenet longicola]